MVESTEFEPSKRLSSEDVTVAPVRIFNSWVFDDIPLSTLSSEEVTAEVSIFPRLFDITALDTSRLSVVIEEAAPTIVNSFPSNWDWIFDWILSKASNSSVDTLEILSCLLSNCDWTLDWMLSKKLISYVDIFTPSRTFISADPADKPLIRLSSAVVVFKPSSMLISSAEAVTPSSMFNSEVVSVALSSMLISSAEAVSPRFSRLKSRVCLIWSEVESFNNSLAAEVRSVVT